MDRHDQQEVRKVAAISSLFMPDMVEYLQFAISLMMVLMGWTSITLEVFLRRDFGERYLSWVRIWLSGVFLMLVGLWIGLVGGSKLYVLYVLGYFAFCLGHQARMWWRGTMIGQPWHSMSFGVSWFEPVVNAISREINTRAPLWVGRALKLDDWFLYRFVEPLWCLWIAWLTYKVSPIFGGWLYIAAISMGIKNQIIYAQQRSRFLDIIDAQLEAQYFTPALHGERKKDTAGFALVSLPPVQRQRIEEVAADIEEDLAETVKETMGEHTAAAAAGPADTASGFSPDDFAATVGEAMGEDVPGQPARTPAPAGAAGPEAMAAASARPAAGRGGLSGRWLLYLALLIAALFVALLVPLAIGNAVLRRQGPAQSPLLPFLPGRGGFVPTATLAFGQPTVRSQAGVPPVTAVPTATAVVSQGVVTELAAARSLSSANRVVEQGTEFKVGEAIWIAYTGYSQDTCKNRTQSIAVLGPGRCSRRSVRVTWVGADRGRCSDRARSRRSV